MVAHLVRLKLALLRNGLRRSPWQVVAMVFGALYGLGALALVSFGLVGLAMSDSVVLKQAVLVVAGSALVLGWAVLPLVAFGVDATLDPARFVTFPIPRRRLLAGLGLSGLIGVPGAVTVLAVAGSAMVWWRSPAAVLVALLTGALAVALAVSASRATTTAAARALSGRRSREVTGVAVMLLLAVGYLLFGRLVTGELRADRLRESLSGVVDVLGWTPFGAAWQAPADVVAGHWSFVAARVGVLVVSLAVVVLVWDRALARALVQPLGEASGTGGSARGLGWFGVLPDRPLGAIAARSLTYWRRDPRYSTALLAVPLMPLAMWAFGVGEGVIALVPLLAAVMGWTLSTDTSSDGTALWLHVASPLRGVDDRAGRVLGAGAVMVPLLIALTVVLGVIAGHLADLPALLGGALGTLLTALGAASVMSALVVLRVQQAGENPFGTRQGASVVSVLGQLGGFLVVGVLALPGNLLGLLAVLWGSAALGWVALLVGVVLGAVLLVIGVRWGGHLIDRRGPVLLQQLVSVA
ncbi:hypothetical protein OEB99_19000 [Actinotalea sp. M2MS4P-6]|uniref:hypothetical protein n=1 Tax=Actinotalea sp. M2MS4P-6 TaxID=2983762 RepID=UPI0021E38031|nr:hypothetical protein [Actinotalea sp. M2MS4P-6]MCV2396404.1 hypothetical protein [Actinotalea sp. M2MS4P-6]